MTLIYTITIRPYQRWDDEEIADGVICRPARPRNRKKIVTANSVVGALWTLNQAELENVIHVSSKPAPDVVEGKYEIQKFGTPRF